MDRCVCDAFIRGVPCLWRALFALWLRCALLVAFFVCAVVSFTARLCHCFDSGVLPLWLAFLRRVVFGVR